MLLMLENPHLPDPSNSACLGMCKEIFQQNCLVTASIQVACAHTQQRMYGDNMGIKKQFNCRLWKDCSGIETQENQYLEAATCTYLESILNKSTTAA